MAFHQRQRTANRVAAETARQIAQPKRGQKMDYATFIGWAINFAFGILIISAITGMLVIFFAPTWVMPILQLFGG